MQGKKVQNETKAYVRKNITLYFEFG